MNEPKRRGRPSREVLEAAAKLKDAVTAPAVWDAPPQAYAMRVWKGQSVNVPYGERRWRVQKALEAQGMTMDGVTLPEAE